MIPSLLEALWAVIGEVSRGGFAWLTIRLGNVVTFKQGKSPYWEIYGHPFRGMVDFAKGALPTGWAVLSLSPEYRGDLSQKQLLLRGMNVEGKKGTLQIEFANCYRAILRRWKLLCVFLEWDQAKEELMPAGLVTDF